MFPGEVLGNAARWACVPRPLADHDDAIGVSVWQGFQQHAIDDAEMAVLAPMAGAMVATHTAVKAGDRHNMRAP